MTPHNQAKKGDIANIDYDGYLDGERFIAAELWHSKRTNEDVLKIHYGMKDFQGLHKLLNP